MKWWWWSGSGAESGPQFVHGGAVLHAAPRCLVLEAREETAVVYETAEKTAYESVLVTLDITPLLNYGEAVAGVTSVTASAPSGGTAPTISANTYSGNKVQFRAAGGTAGLYLVTVRFTTSLTSDLREAFCNVAVV